MITLKKKIFIDLDSRGTPPRSTRVTRQVVYFPIGKKDDFFQLQSSTSQGRPNTKKHLGIPQNGLTNHLDDVHRQNYPCFGPPPQEETTKSLKFACLPLVDVGRYYFHL